MPKSDLYEQDFHAWAYEQAALLRNGHASAADLENIAEEIESMGRSEKRELISRLGILLMHLLKWQYQPDRRGASWEGTIIVQRLALQRHLRDNPSLKAKLDEALADAYADAVPMTMAETNLPKTTFPSHCPWSFDQIMEEQLWPEMPGEND
ncbi:MAG: DUF29 domain-containing protein [Rhodospirillaceae bacterium]